MHFPKPSYLIKIVLFRFITYSIIFVDFLRLDIWSEFKSMYKVSMESMKKCARKCVSSKY